MPPWENWYHCTGNTYGTWLRGDPRGWRARHHRKHVEGDHVKQGAAVWSLIAPRERSIAGPR